MGIGHEAEGRGAGDDPAPLPPHLPTAYNCDLKLLNLLFTVSYLFLNLSILVFNCN